MLLIPSTLAKCFGPSDSLEALNKYVEFKTPNKVSKINACRWLVRPKYVACVDGTNKIFCG